MSSSISCGVNMYCSSSSFTASTSFVKAPVLASLKAEHPAYLAKASGIDPDINPLIWWQTHSSELPRWCAVAANILLVQPYSAAAERIFHFLNHPLALTARQLIRRLHWNYTNARFRQSLVTAWILNHKTYFKQHIIPNSQYNAHSLYCKWWTTVPSQNLQPMIL